MKNKANTHHLTVDIGNTNVVLGIFKNGKIRNKWRLNTQKNVTNDEIIFTLKHLFNSRSKSFPPISDIALASVVPGITYQWSNALMEIFQVQSHIISPKNCLNLKLEFEHPEEIGADRLCNVLACQSKGFKNAIVIDFGTATTFDVFRNETYLGGVICPGIQSSMTALTEKASRLLDVDLFWNEKITGQNTDDALRNGILYGTLGQVEYIVSKIIQEQYIFPPSIIATGGLADMISSRCSVIKEVDEDLTLIGLNYYILTHIH